MSGGKTRNENTTTTMKARKTHSTKLKHSEISSTVQRERVIAIWVREGSGNEEEERKKYKQCKTGLLSHPTLPNRPAPPDLIPLTHFHPSPYPHTLFRKRSKKAKRRTSEDDDDDGSVWRSHFILIFLYFDYFYPYSSLLLVLFPLRHDRLRLHASLADSHGYQHQLGSVSSTVPPKTTIDRSKGAHSNKRELREQKGECGPNSSRQEGTLTQPDRPDWSVVAERTKAELNRPKRRRPTGHRAEPRRRSTRTDETQTVSP